MKPNRRFPSFPVSLSGVGKTAVIYPSAFLVALGEGMLSLGLVFFMRESYGASAALIGYLMAFSTLVYIAGCLFVRPFFDSVRPRYLLMLATGGMAVFLVLLVFFRSIPLTFLFLGLNKLFASLFWPPAMGWLSQGIEGKALNRTMGRFNLSWSAGLVVSPALAGWLSERSAELPLFGALLAFTSTLLLITGAALALPRVRGDTHREGRRAAAAGKTDRSTSLRFPAWLGLFTSYVAVGVIASIFPIFARDDLLIRKSLIGGLMSARTFAQAAGFLLLGRMSFWHFKGRFNLVGQLFLGLLLLTMLRGRTPLFFLATLPLLGLSTAFHYSSSIFHGISGSTRRASRMAIHESLLTGGFIAGSAAGGLLYQSFSMQAAFLFCAVWAAVGLLVQVVVLRVTRS